MAVAAPRRSGRLAVAVCLAAGAVALVFIAFMAALLGQQQSAVGACGAGSAYSPSRAALADIPGNYLGPIRAAGRKYRIDWTVIAGIYSIETDFGRLDAPGVRSGENFAGAGGPGQFLAASWAQFGVDGDGDGTRDRYNPRDAIPATGNYLSRAGGQSQIERAVFAYNHASWYVDDVLRRAARYRGAAQAAGSIPVANEAGSQPVCVAGGELAVGQANARELLQNPRVVLSGSHRSDLSSGQIDGRVVATLVAIAERHSVTVTSLKSDHDIYTTSGNRSNHADGRAVDIGAVDGQPCTPGSRQGKCGQLAVQLGRVEGRMRSTELIYCFDPDGGDPRGFARADHCDHIHAGYRSTP